MPRIRTPNDADDFVDTDQDGTPNFTDTDSDNDGVPDTDETPAGDPYADVDNDGVPAYLDDDDTDNTVGNDDMAVEMGFDVDDNDVADAADPNNDSDGDDVPNGVETAENSDPIDTNDFLDTDGDGTPDFVDADSDNDGTPDVDETGGDPYADLDNDGVPAYLDDNDNDLTVGNDDGTVEMSFDDNGDGVADFQDSTTDSDGDGVPNLVEVAEGTDPDDPDDFVDTDQDGTPNFTDTDSDNDGVIDEDETPAGDPYADLDGDGVPAYLDDDDTDGTVGDDDMSVEMAFDVDGNDVPDGNDPNNDTDGDTVPNGVETAEGTDPLDDTDFLDSDGDGTPDYGDADADNDGISSDDEAGGDPYVDMDNDGVPVYLDGDDNDLTVGADGVQTPYDTDADGIIDARDRDSDNDGLTDTREAYQGNPTYGDPDNDGFLNNLDGSPVTTDSDGAITGLDYDLPKTDTDGDQVPNYLDLDSDGDGLPDAFEGNFEVADPDNDGRVGEGIAPDADGDGIADSNDPDSPDNVLDGFGFDQDRDGDGVPNYLDIDTDNDGIVDNIEGQSTFSYFPPSGADVNGNGLDDRYDVSAGGLAIGYTNSDGGSAPDYADTNSDTESADNSVEPFDIEENGVPGAPFTPEGVLDVSGGFNDSDGDGLADIFDQVDGFTTDGNANNGQVPADLPGPVGGERDFRDSGDNDGDGIADADDADDDNDGIPDAIEDPLGLNTDRDGDGLPDSRDLDSDGDGIPDVTEAGGDDPDGDGFPGTGPPVIDPITGTPAGAMYVEIDTDGDGVENYLDLDSDNDGIPDAVEAGGTDANGDGILGAGVANDSDADGLADAVDPYDNVNETTDDGTPLALVNTDDNGPVDYLDLDSDDDGILDVVEGGSPDGDNNGLVGVGSGDEITDADGDGLADVVDPVDNLTGTAGAEETAPVADTDGDGLADYVDIDSDDDGLVDYLEAQLTGADPYLSPVVEDGDNDGLVDIFDNLVGFGGAGLTPVDTDMDAVADYVDLDSDDDGLEDVTESGLGDPSGTDANQDGLDGAYPVEQTFTDLANDDLPGTAELDFRELPLDADNDTDGVPNLVEVAEDTDPNDADNFLDTDGDGTPDFTDEDSDNDGVPDNDETPAGDPYADLDLDGVPAYLDDDDTDNQVGNDDGVPTMAFDVDGNGTPDFQDNSNDTDGDSVPNPVEVAEATDPTDGDDFLDTDQDGTPNFTDTDSDNDGVPDTDETPAGDPYADVDEDGIPAYLDDDDTDNTVGNDDMAVEMGFDVDNNDVADGADPNNDSDGDDVPNGVETAEGSDPANPDNSLDTDGDGTPDFVDEDSDDDGVPDLNETGGDPYVDLDNDGVPAYLDDNDGDLTTGNDDGAVESPFDGDDNGVADFQEVNLVEDDLDNDGVPNSVEIAEGTDPEDGDDFLDTDQDGTPNFADTDSDNDGVPDTDETPAGDPYADVDEDGIPAYLDDDDTDDTVGDDDMAVEMGFDVDDNDVADGVDPNNDSDGDDVPNGVETAEGTDPTNPDISLDTDGDGTPDFVDLDSDDDGVDDTDESGGDPYVDQDNDGVPAYLDDNDDDLTVGNDDGAVETDFDEDGNGVADFQEAPLTGPCDEDPLGATCANGDPDNDGVVNADEPGGNPFVDADDDGVPVWLDDNDGDAAIGNDDGAADLAYDINRDGIADALDPCIPEYDPVDCPERDPTGYFYCTNTGEIIPGGRITITATDGNAESIRVLSDGSDGFYQFYNGNGTFVLTITAPPGFELDADRLAASIGLFAVPNTRMDVLVGSADADGDGFLDDFSAAANPFYTGYVYEDVTEEGNVFLNNIPVSCESNVQLACNGVINITLEDNCQAVITPSMVLVGDFDGASLSNFEVTILDVGSDTIPGCGEYMYQVGAVAGANINGFTQCMGMVIASDKTPPVLVATPSDVTGLLCVDVAANNLNALPATVSRCFRVDGDGALDSASIVPALLAVLSPASFDNLDVDVALIPTFTDNCASALEVCVSDVVSQEDEDGCGPTVITRTFRATVAEGCDADDTELVASYTITFEQPNLGQLISEPVMPTVEIEACATATAPTDFLPTSAEYPQLEVPSGDTVRTFAANDPALMCANLVTTFETTNAVQTCESTVKFSRVYRVIDWCEPGTAREFTQFVKVGDSTGPVFTGPTVPGADTDSTATLVFGTNVGDVCAATVRLDGPGITVQDACSGTDVELIVSIYPDGDLTRAPFGAYPVDLTDADAELSDALPVGDYAFVYTATDACGNATVTSVPFAVADRSGPVAICEDGLNVSLSVPAGVGVITADQADLGSYDDCGGDVVTLAIGRSAAIDVPPTAFFDALTLTCADLGTTFVTLEVTDADSNSNFCQLRLLVEQKVGDECICNPDGEDCDGDGTGATLTGRIATQAGRAVSQVEVTLTGSDAMDRMRRTNDEGEFNFERVPLDGDYTVQPEHDVAIDLREVKISDVVAISRVILGVTSFDDAYDYAGADVNQSGSINVLDMVAIQRVILGLEDVYPTGESWRFVASTHTVTNDNWMEAFPEVYNVNNLSGNLLGVDFVAVELGNVIGGRGRASLDLELEDAKLGSGQTHTMTFGSTALAGWQGTLEVGRDLEIVNVDYTGEGGLNTAYTPEGVVGMLLRSAGEIELTVRAVNPVVLSEAIELTDGLVLQEGVGQTGEPVGLGLAFTQLTLGSLESPTTRAPATAQNALYQNVPNPVVDRALIEFDLAEAGEATLTVRDITGRLLVERTVDGISGRNQVVLGQYELGATGMLTYTLKSGDFSASKRMLVVRQ